MKQAAKRTLLLCILIALAACSQLPFLPTTEAPPVSDPTSEATPQPTQIPPPPIQVAEITFRVTIPGDTPSDGPIQLSVLDEVT